MDQVTGESGKEVERSSSPARGYRLKVMGPDNNNYPISENPI